MRFYQALYSEGNRYSGYRIYERSRGYKILKLSTGQGLVLKR
jgi:hypothetical protein